MPLVSSLGKCLLKSLKIIISNDRETKPCTNRPAERKSSQTKIKLRCFRTNCSNKLIVKKTRKAILFLRNSRENSPDKRTKG